MIVLFGPAGAGKSVQGQFLAAREGWRWLSIGQLLRDTRDPEIHAHLQAGTLVAVEKTEQVMADAINQAKDIPNLTLDGFPREMHQAQWLVEQQDTLDRKLELAVVLEVPREELMKRLELRGRADDTPEAIDERLSIYRTEIYPILNHFSEHGIPVVHIAGTGTVGQVHDRIIAELQSRGLVK